MIRRRGGLPDPLCERGRDTIMTSASKRRWRALALAGALLAATGPAGAVTFVDLGGLPQNPKVLPAPTATAGVVELGTSGSITNVRLDLWAGTALAGSQYNSIRNGSATYDFGRVAGALNIVWGSPDTWNSIAFFNGGSLVTTITGGDFAAAFGMTLGAADQTWARIRDITGNGLEGFDRVVLASTQAALEYAHVEAVPEIDALSGLGALGALGGLMAFGWERRRGRTA
jgi:hypothetical protein